MSKPNRRRVRMDQFKRQMAEQVLPDDSLVQVELDEVRSVQIKIPVMLDEDDDFPARIEAAESLEEMALVLLSGGSTPAEEQWETWKAAGYDAVDLMKVYATERAGAEERMRQFRYKG